MKSQNRWPLSGSMERPQVTSGAVGKGTPVPPAVEGEPAWRPCERSWACQAEGNWGGGGGAASRPHPCSPCRWGQPSLLCRAGETPVMASSGLFTVQLTHFSTVVLLFVGLGFQLSHPTNISTKERQARSGFHCCSPSTWLFTGPGAHTALE